MKAVDAGAQYDLNEIKVRSETARDTDGNQERSAHIDAYIRECLKEAGCLLHPEWLREFFHVFGSGIQDREFKAKKGDRNKITGPFGEAFKRYLVPHGAKCVGERSLSEFSNEKGDIALLNRLGKKKKIDFAVEGKTGLLLIEFKSSMSFNDFSAALVEMALAKSLAPQSDSTCQLKTAVLFLHPASSTIGDLQLLNEKLGGYVDHIWLLCNKTGTREGEFVFDIAAIKSLRETIDRLVN